MSPTTPVYGDSHVTVPRFIRDGIDGRPGGPRRGTSHQSTRDNLRLSDATSDFQQHKCLAISIPQDKQPTCCAQHRGLCM